MQWRPARGHTRRIAKRRVCFMSSLVSMRLPVRLRGRAVRALLLSVWRHQKLVRELARRETVDLHAGQIGGTLWVLMHPLLMFAVYAFLFTAVFKVRIADRGPSDYLVYLFAGLSPWLLTQDVLSRATSVMIGNAAIVKKVLFPAEVLVAKSLGASLRVQSVLYFLVFLFVIFTRERLSWSFLLIPPLLITHFLLLWGLALFLSVLTPYIRDLSELVRVFTMINVYLMPVMYLPEMTPVAFRDLLVLNPFSHLIWCYQDVIYYNSLVHPGSWVALVVSALLSCLAGSYVFMRLRAQLASVI